MQFSLGDLVADVGRIPRVGAYERVVEVSGEPGVRWTVLLDVLRVHEFKYSRTVTDKGIRLIEYTRTAASWRVNSVQQLEPLDKPVIYAEYVQTESAYRAKREWEELCYRPGDNSRFGGRDSVARYAQGYTAGAFG